MWLYNIRRTLAQTVMCCTCTHVNSRLGTGLTILTHSRRGTHKKASGKTKVKGRILQPPSTIYI